MSTEYEYVTIRSYGETAEIKRYQKRPTGGRRVGGRPKQLSDSNQSALLAVHGQDNEGQRERAKARTEANARGARRAFSYLVGANLDRRDVPILVSLTYRENMGDLDRAREDFKVFSKRATNTFGKQIRYISVVEFQERGAIHFHALFWGIKKKVVASERRTRLFATLWGQGFTDVIKTDGSPKLAGYMASYFHETFKDPRLFGRRAYTCSRNCIRPTYIKDAVLAPHFMGMAEPDLSTAHVAQEVEYDTVWLGRCNYQRLLTLDK